MDILAFTVLLSGFLIIYHHALFPLVLKLLYKFNSDIEDKENLRRFVASESDRSLPSVTIVIPAYNESAYIHDKITNLACLDYPEGKLKIIIACDGCTDDTYAKSMRSVAQNSHSPHYFKVINYFQNSGKVKVLNKVMQDVDTDLVAFSDVSALVSLDGLLQCANHFQNPKVGAVSGAYRLLAPKTEGEKKYWLFQTKVKVAEASIGSTIGAHGAFYMVRRSLFTALPEDTINDDLIIPMSMVSQGFETKYDPSVIAVELEGSDQNMDWNRRLRIGAGNLQQMLRLKHVMLPKFKGTALNFFSGKVLRILQPVLMLFVFYGSFILAFDSIFFLVIFIAQCFGYGVAALYHFFDVRIFSGIGKTIAYIVVGHVANFIGASKYIIQSIKS